MRSSQREFKQVLAKAVHEFDLEAHKDAARRLNVATIAALLNTRPTNDDTLTDIINTMLDHANWSAQAMMVVTMLKCRRPGEAFDDAYMAQLYQTCAEEANQTSRHLRNMIETLLKPGGET